MLLFLDLCLVIAVTMKTKTSKIMPRRDVFHNVKRGHPNATKSQMNARPVCTLELRGGGGFSDSQRASGAA